METGQTGVPGVTAQSPVGVELRSRVAVVMILLQRLVDLFALEIARNPGNVTMRRVEVSAIYLFIYFTKKLMKTKQTITQIFEDTQLLRRSSSSRVFAEMAYLCPGFLRHLLRFYHQKSEN